MQHRWFAAWLFDTLPHLPGPSGSGHLADSMCYCRSQQVFSAVMLLQKILRCFVLILCVIVGVCACHRCVQLCIFEVCAMYML